MRSAWGRGYLDDFFLDVGLEVLLRDFLGGGSEVERDFAHGGYEGLLHEVETGWGRCYRWVPET